MDIQLPGINGIEALQRLRADPLTTPTPVIAVTASVMTHDRARIMAAGFNGFQEQADQREPVAGHGARGSRQAVKFAAVSGRRWDLLTTCVFDRSRLACRCARHINKIP